MTARFLADVPADQYHADSLGDAPTPTLSASVASVLIRQSPYHAWLRHPKLGNVDREATPAMERGTLIHALTLGKGMDRVKVLQFDSYRTKAAQEARDAATAAGRTPILAREMGGAQRVADDILAALADEGIHLTGVSEAVAEWEEDAPAGPIPCRGMMDHVLIGDGFILDLKTCRSAHPKACRSHVEEFGYAIQAAAYRSAMEKIRPDLAGRVRYVWAFAEEVNGGPRRAIVTLAEPDGSMRELGERQWRRAVRTWADCLQSGKWPTYGNGRRVALAASPWAIADEDAA